MADQQQLEDTNFDIIVLGTGLVESIIAGALARAGKKVLHLDVNAHYGGQWSVFGFRELLSWHNDMQIPPCANGSTIDYSASNKRNFKNVVFQLHSQPNQEAIELDPTKDLSKTLQSYLPTLCQSESDLLKEALEKEIETLKENTNITESVSKLRVLAAALKETRSYNLDLAPKYLACQGEMIEALIRSGVGQYLEFKGVEDIFIFDKEEGQLQKVPGSKEDVFVNKKLTLVDKRKLMKFLTYAMKFQDEPAILEGCESMPYNQFLEEKFKLSEQLRSATVYAIALLDGEGLQRTQTFMRSFGRFTKGGYLCPLYGGASEIAQAFCRICAVYGGVYMLNQELQDYEIDEESRKCTGVVTKDGQIFKCQWLVAGIDYLDKEWLPSDETSLWVSRAILVTDKGLAKGTGNNGLGYSVFPPDSIGNAKPIYAIHQNHESMACPKDQYVTYLWTESSEYSEKLLEKAIASLVKDDAKRQFTMMYQQRVRQTKGYETLWKLPSNVIPCSDPNLSLDFEDAVKEAMAAFHRCTSEDTEFMPATEQQREVDDY
ncbi:hypothetical protein EC973_007248 [Apophysomyces ossiformis]|uniref:Rab escort protein 1 n=1 Tax=Apophysomyces ossiformis TaxID=679940 RepID=A0A8H7BUZ9_9FUNG|nr:hypothetical protein EC973_007248 [Apophysomyces ossiformis]